MFMILGLHVNMLAIGLPSKSDIINNPLSSITRLFLENLCIIGINIFVLISGWFGIKYKTKGLCNFLFQSLFFSIIFFIPFVITGKVELTRVNILSAFLLYKNAYWFVWAYLILYIISPILNSFIEHAPRNTYKRVLILFFAVQTITFLFTSCGFFNGGYNPLSFIGLYLLMRYIKKHSGNFKKRYLLTLWLLCTIINTSLCYTGNNTLTTISIAYINPLNIISATALVLFFTKLPIKSKTINYISVSCFAVYLAHMHFCVFPYYKTAALTIFNKNGGIIYLFYILLFMIIVFAGAVIIDKMRIFTFNKIWYIIENKQDAR